MADEQAGTLSEAFWTVARTLRHHSRETLAPWDLNPSHARALAVLVRHDVLRLSDLADHLDIAPRSATEVVDALEDRGLVQRQPDPADRRATLITLTARGIEVSQHIRSTREDEVEKVFGILSATDRKHLARILRKLSARPRNPQ